MFANWSSIQSRAGAIPDQTDGMSGSEHGPKPQAKTPTRMGSPLGCIWTAGPPLSALQTFPPRKIVLVHMSVDAKALPMRIMS